MRLSIRRAEPCADGAQPPPAVYVHGLGGSALNWTDLMGLLRDRVDGVAIDLPGFGESPPPADGDYSTFGHARAVLRLIEWLGKGPVHLLGNSMGGAVAVRVAAQRPDLVRTLTLISPALPDLRLRRTSASTGLLAVPGIGHALTRWIHRMPPERRAQAAAELVYANAAAVPEPLLRIAAEEYAKRSRCPWAQQALLASARGIIRAYLERGPQSLWSQAARVRAPTLLVYGRQDKLVDSRLAVRAAETFPRSRLVVLPDSGHVAMMEHPRLVAAAVRELLEDSERETGTGQ
ncbi:putative hydrolase [Carbonactinospora thermoautotrophica]|uniref:Putative hydrolase n=3 Tax=Carbonactinospora thermoautotrophica TaxID=1469144 RepID=A0A132MPG2_9ACTN|nr:alpha/beta hydrolase [Carbonactinospora thermoautotrophica]KWW99311.1 putative hydrolase [Carbonactinospora thermoautotrophica]